MATVQLQEVFETEDNGTDHYLSEEERTYFHQVLTAWRKRILAEHAESRQRIRRQEERHGDIIDQSVNNHGRVMDIINRDRQQKTLTQIDHALDRLENGSYGYCQISGEEIGIERLRAYPVAILSVTVQEQLERLQRC